MPKQGDPLRNWGFGCYSVWMCPVCTVAVGAGLGLSRALGIDDAVTSVWIGGLILSMSFWLHSWLSKRWSSLHATSYFLLTTFLMYVLTLYPLYWTKYIGRATNTAWGIDKILLGTVVGSLFFLGGLWADKKARAKWGKQFFQYQKVVFPVVALLLGSLLLHFLIP